MIKRVPIVEKGQLVGIVSRANLIQAVARERKDTVTPATDAAVREQVLGSLKSQKWAHTTLLNATATDGVVDLWGLVNSEQERKAIRLLVESITSVREIRDNMTLRPRSGGA
jgi:osmotically-inducible protein OsmY